MKSTEVRSRFLKYFEAHGHQIVPSSSLIPDNDPSLLFTNAGMNQFKNLFLGLEKQKYTRAVSSQKCVRAGGKHNDLDNVGFTARHHTFFEMLGNFSFSDYFKKEAIHFAWEFLTKELNIPKEKLYITVFRTDDEAEDIWHKQEGVPRDRIFRFDEKDNFWRMGDTGPCGPSSEIFYDHGERAGRETDPFKGIACGEDRFIEIWNLVFMQYFEKAPGQLELLPAPSVDTGSGLERVAALMQGKLNNYNTDLFWPMIERAANIAGKTNLLDLIQDTEKLGIHAKISNQNLEQIAALRVIADHIRSCSFLIADGALPSNEGRGYVLRRILRRAVRFCNKLTGDHAFLPEVSETFIGHMGLIYPELQQRREFILSTIADEQERFLATLHSGNRILEESLSKLAQHQQKQLSGEIAFKLYDTYGFPLDLTTLMAGEKGFSVDQAGFEEKMQQARQKAKASWKGHSIPQDEAHLVSWVQKMKSQLQQQHFTGYESLQESTRILGLSNGKQEVKELRQGDTGWVILEKTPFYAEGGGQIGDHGEIKTQQSVAVVGDCQKKQDLHLHLVKIEVGSLEVGQNVNASVETRNRKQIAANHSATHLMHAALRKILGSHVTQAGSLVDEQKLRFDFTHNKALSAEELRQVETSVNEAIQQSLSVAPQVMSHKEALSSGALALFGEKYGEQVRVLKMGDFSCELCGGTHVRNTSEIRLFKIVSESGVSAGVRRIEAITGSLALAFYEKHFREHQKAKQEIGQVESWNSFLDSSSEITDWIRTKKEEIKSLEKEIKSLKGAQVNLDQIIASSHQFQLENLSGKLAIADLDEENREVLSQLADSLKNKLGTGIVVVAGQSAQGRPLTVCVTKDLTAKIQAGSLLRELAAAMGGKGGGRPDFAQGLGPQPEKWTLAVNKLKELLKLK
jgi:alanyl-tRNA synthetase